jgi:fluoride exporter
MMKQILWVALGGAFGAATRFWISNGINSNSFPWGILFINILGSLIVGILAGFIDFNKISQQVWLFAAIGFCGGFTTFSAFSLETWRMFTEQKYFHVLAYVICSVMGGIVATAIGMFMIKNIIHNK